MKCSQCGKKAIWIGCTPTGDKYMLKCHCVTSSVMVATRPDEGVTRCEICQAELTGYSNAKTCSPRCRVALHRRNKALKK